jgi:hypothetical protein
MKISSITFIDAANLPIKAKRNTERAQQVAQILGAIEKCPTGKAIAIDTEKVEKFERYQLQKALQDSGAKVVVLLGANSKTGKPALFVRRLTDAEWKEYNA